MNGMRRRACLGLLLCGPLACSSESGSGGTPEGSNGDPPAEVLEPGLSWGDDGTLTFRTEPFDVEPGSESYLCWTTPVQEDLKINEFHFSGATAVHHFILPRRLRPSRTGGASATRSSSPPGSPSSRPAPGPTS